MAGLDIVIPVFDPSRDGRFLRSLELLYSQEKRADKIIIMNTGEELFDLWAEKNRISERFPDLTVEHVTKKEFDHAGTRNRGAALGGSEFILFMTMDAVPADTSLTRILAEALESDSELAIAYARQTAAPDAAETERYARSFNYPKTSRKKTLADEKQLGIKASFASNVCSMYRRSVFEKLGGFAVPSIFNEDMVLAHSVLHAGYGIKYCADACVEHSHNYTASDQFHRNFDLGVSQAMHPEVFGQVSSESEGKRFVSGTIRHLRKTGNGRQIPGFLAVCAARYAGYLLGKNYRRLPEAVILKCTNQKEFWRKDRDS